MRRITKGYLIFALVLASVMLFVHRIEAAGDPGTESDPAVAQSYVDAKVADLQTQLNTLSLVVSDLNRKLQQTPQGQASGFVVAELKAGQQVAAAASTEIILRSGQATAVGSVQGGLSDVTEGKDIKTGEFIAKDHLLIVPRDDGRGVRLVTDAVFMIKGPYTVK